jgi:uncharacterized membrane protein
MTSFTLLPIQEGVRVQVRATNDVLSVINKLNEIAARLEGPQKEELLKCIEELAEVSDRLLDNAGAASTFIRNVAG